MPRATFISMLTSSFKSDDPLDIFMFMNNCVARIIGTLLRARTIRHHRDD